MVEGLEGVRLIEVPIAHIRPTEFFVPKDKIDEIADHYDGTMTSILPIQVYGINPELFIPADGNKRAVYLHAQGHEYIRANLLDVNDEVPQICGLAVRAGEFGVKSVADLMGRVLNTATYDVTMARFNQDGLGEDHATIIADAIISGASFNGMKRDVDRYFAELGEPEDRSVSRKLSGWYDIIRARQNQ